MNMPRRLDVNYAILGFTISSPSVILMETFEDLNLAAAKIELLRHEMDTSSISEDDKTIYILMEQINYKIVKTERI